MASKFICKEDYPVVSTKAGKVRGYQLDDTVIFQGIKYADADRFLMPREVEPWEGVKDVQSYGYVCPLLKQDTPSAELMVPHLYWPMDEHCQYLNIWTPSIEEGKKYPVMVWLHGGGFFAGSSIEQLAYEGTNMSKYGEVVVVSLNHRLNVLGYLDLSPFGEKYQHSANVGTADIIAALQWVQDNIAGFGGDPDNVTIFGQSGGGGKVWTLMQTPEADGLYHKGIIESGVYDTRQASEVGDGENVVKAMLKELGLGVDEVEKLETIPYAQLAEAYNKVAADVAAAGSYTGNAPHPDQDYVGDPLKVGFREETKNIPLMIGTVFGEFDFNMPIDDKYELDDETVIGMITERFGEEGTQLISLYRQTYPDNCLADLLSVDTRFRAPSIEFIKERCKCGASPIYSYQFNYEFPLYHGKMAWHCSEIPFVFHNIDKVPICNREEDAEGLQEDVFGAWISFAKSGAPKIKGVEWPECHEGDEATMILDTTCEVRHNFDHDLVQKLVELEEPNSFKAGNVQH